MATKNTNETGVVSGWVLCANDLLLGDLVYLSDELDWTTELAAAKKIVDEDAAEKLLNQVVTSRADEVVSAELAPVLLHADQSVELTRLRDRFKEAGPTHRPDLPREASARNDKVQSESI